MHGESDTTARIRQSELMDDVLEAAGKDAQFIRFLREMEKFLEAHIGLGVTARK